MGRKKLKQITWKTQKSSKVSNFKRNCKCTFHSVLFYEDDASGHLCDVNSKEIKDVKTGYTKLQVYKKTLDLFVKMSKYHYQKGIWS